MSLDKQVRDLFREHGVDLAADDVWTVQRATVVRHKALERLAAAARVVWLPPSVVFADATGAALLVQGTLEDRLEWSVGEARIGTNYQVSGKQAAYPWAMAEKRGKDRVILKLVGLHGFYSEEEADEFKAAALPQPEPASPLPPPPSEPSPRQRYLEETARKIRFYPGTEAQLREWWDSERQTRRDFDLDKKDVDALVKLIGKRIEKMKEAA